MEILFILGYIAIAIIILLFMIMIHELGHYIAAKILGFRVKEFAIGFGKVLFKRENKKTGEVFTLRLIPLGGFCSFEGDDDLENKINGKDNKAADKDINKTNDSKRSYEDAMSGTTITTIPKSEDGNKKIKRKKNLLSYSEQPPWKRLIVLFAGGFFNFVCAVLFSIVLLMLIGYNQLITVTGVNNDYSDLMVGDTIHSMAIATGFDPNTDNPADLTLTFTEFRILNSFNAMVGNVDPGTQTIIFRVYDASGQAQLRYANLRSAGESVWVVPINGTIDARPMGFFETIWLSFVFCIEMAWIMLAFLWGLITGQVSLSGIGGPITTVSIMTQFISSTWLNIFILVPMISVNLALFNLLPIPALDGARMVFTGIEWVRGKPINPEIEMRIHMVGLILLFAFVIFVDLNFLFGGGGGLNFALFERWNL